MMRLGGTHLFGFALRLIAAVVCLVPFTGPRKASVAGGSSPVLPSHLPSAPANEEDESEREQESAKECAASPRAGARTEPGRNCPRYLATGGKSSTSCVPRPCPSRTDPFRNGLGTAYRC